jgi:signal transduction protein with GAF and PtsI domain
MNPGEKVFFESFREVVKAVHSTLDIKAVLNLLVKKVAEAMNLKGCAIRLLDSTRMRLELAAACGLSEPYLMKGAVDVDRSLSEVMRGKTVTVYNAQEDPAVQYRKAAAEEGIASLISVPLSVKGRIIGALRLYTAEPRVLSAEEMNFVEALAEMGAIAIENARMYEQVRKDYEAVMTDLGTFYDYRRSI